MESGLKLVALLNSAVMVERRYEARADLYSPEHRQLTVELALVRAEQIVPKHSPPGPLLIGSDS